MTRANRVRAVIALAVTALSAILAMTQQPRLGIDLRGGTQIVLESRDSASAKATPSATDDTMEVLRQRVDALGVAEPGLVRSGENRIIVELPGLQDPRQAADVLGRTAQLTFHPVQDAPDHRSRTDEGRAGEEPDEDVPRTDEAGRPLRLDGAAMTGEEVKSATAAVDPQRGSGWFVDVAFREAGERKWADLTGEAACSPAGDPKRRVAIVLDGKVVSSPQIDPSVACRHGIAGGDTQITGDFTEKQAKELATLIEGGALPVPVEVIEHHTMGPTLGAEAVEASGWAAAIGVLLTSGFVVLVYRLLGALTAVGLLCYGLISYAALVTFGATLTLPGLAGFVLAIGMAVDANVLVFERAREEYARGREDGRGRRKGSLRLASAKGFREAFGAIADSNVTTLLAALLLFTLASGPVRGFGVTLSIGVLASMVSALVVTRALVDFAVNRRSVRARPRITGLAAAGRVRSWLTRRKPDWMRYGRRWLAVSAAAVVLAVGGIVLRGLDFGVEFTGGRLVEYSTSRAVDPEAARSALADAGLPDAVVQDSGGNTGGDGNGGGDRVTVRAEQLTAAQEETVRSTLAGLGGETGKVRDELFGPSLGEELRHNALIALALALGAQLLYLACRFRWTFGASAVLSLAHDAVILTGAFAWLGRPVDGVFLAALLTVIGYSVNDSVVIFDRVRSEERAGRRESFRSVVNRAVVQTVPRTLNTGMGALFIIAALAVLGGDSLGDFALALLIGIVVGSYSSLFVGAPLAVEFEARTSGRRKARGPHGRYGRPRSASREPGSAPRTRARRSPHDNGARV